MGFLHRIVMVSLLIGFGSFVMGVESLDSLITDLSEPKTGDPAPTTPTDTGEQTTQAKDATAKTAEPKGDEPAGDAPKGDEAKAEPEAKVEPAPKVAPHSILPKITPVVSVTPVASVAKDPTTPKVAPVTQPKIVTAPAPTVAKATVPAVKIVDVHEDTSAGLDTLNIDSGGNWLEKRVWYQKGEQLFEEIRANLQKAGDIRMKFVHEVNQIGQHIDDFYETTSMQKGQIDEMLKAVLQALANQEEVRGGDLGSGERSLQAKVKAEQPQIESISKDLQLIADLDEQIDKTMMKSFKEIDACRALETRAWNSFKEIGLELDDKKARVLYYEMENIHKNIEQKMHYLQTNLLPYLQNQLVSKVQSTITQIKNSAQALDTKGLNLQSLLEKDEQGDLLILKKREKIKEQEIEDAAKAKMISEQQAEQAKAAKSQATDLQNSPWYYRWWSTALLYVQPMVCKLYEWTMIVVCCVQCVVCKLQEWICRLLGY